MRSSRLAKRVAGRFRRGEEGKRLEGEGKNLDDKEGEREALLIKERERGRLVGWEGETRAGNAGEEVNQRKAEMGQAKSRSTQSKPASLARVGREKNPPGQGKPSSVGRRRARLRVIRLRTHLGAHRGDPACLREQALATARQLQQEGDGTSSQAGTVPPSRSPAQPSM